MIVIDGSMMPDKDTAHTYLAERLSLPDYYGRNLDALYDILAAGLEVPTCLILYRRKDLEAAMGSYGTALLNVMKDAALENPYLQIVCDGDDK